MNEVRALLFVLLSMPVGFALPETARAQWQIDGVPVCNPISSQSFPVSVEDGMGGAIVAWIDNRNGNDDIYAQHVLASGVVDPGWPVDGSALCTAANSQDNPSIASDEAGGAIVTWTDFRTGTNLDIYAQRVLATGAVDPAWPADGLPICTHTAFQISQIIVSDGAGGAIVAWEDTRNGDNDVYTQRALTSGTVDPAWPVNGLGVCTAVNNQITPSIVSDDAGGAIIAWSDVRAGFGFLDIYAQRVLASGVVDPAWPSNGRSLCAATNNQVNPTIASDGANGAIVTWIDLRGTNRDIYAQRVQASGAVDPAWPVNGTALCSASADQNTPTVVSDDAGGAIVTWQDLRNGGGEADIYAQHVLASGAVDGAWPVDGTALCSAANNQFPAPTPAIIPDGAGGAIVAWSDERTGSPSDVYAQRVLASGTVDGAWPVDGRALCTFAGVQQHPTIVTNGSGGAIVAWNDSRDGNSDIYAQRIYATGEVVSVPIGGRSAPFALGSPRPNPTQGVPVTLTFELPAAQRIQVEIFDLAGHRVRTLASGRQFGAGPHSLIWEGKNDAGALVPNGIYLVQVRSGRATAAQKVAVVH